MLPITPTPVPGSNGSKAGMLFGSILYQITDWCDRPVVVLRELGSD